MAISRLSGQMFQSTLLRDGIPLSFQDTVSSNSVLFLDIANTQVGINANVLSATFQVDGNILSTADISTNANLNATVAVNSGNIVSSDLLNIYSGSSGNILIDASGYTKIVGTDAFYVPVGNTNQRPGTPDVGAVRFNTTLVCLEVWDGSTWAAATNDLSVISNQTILPDGSSASYTLNQTTDAESILVTINGLNQTPAVDYTVAGNSITFTTTPLQTDIVQVRFIVSTATVTSIVSGNSSVEIIGTNSNVDISVDGTLVAEFSNTGTYVSSLFTAEKLQLPIYTVAEATALTGSSTGQLIYVSNGDSGNPCLAVYSGGAWRRVTLGATIST